MKDNARKKCVRRRRTAMFFAKKQVLPTRQHVPVSKIVLFRYKIRNARKSGIFCPPDSGPCAGN
jgi:hypothetical protein